MQVHSDQDRCDTADNNSKRILNCRKQGRNWTNNPLPCKCHTNLRPNSLRPGNVHKDQRTESPLVQLMAYRHFRCQVIISFICLVFHQNTDISLKNTWKFRQQNIFHLIPVMISLTNAQRVSDLLSWLTMHWRMHESSVSVCMNLPCQYAWIF